MIKSRNRYRDNFTESEKTATFFIFPLENDFAALIYVAYDEQN